MVTPYQTGASKSKQVAEMFDNISARYDFLNHLLSLGIDRVWRKKAIRLLASGKPQYILDIATGTGDFAIEALSLNPKKITGVDISAKMLEVGKEKIRARQLNYKIELLLADSEKLPFPGNMFDAITVGFGVRNFEHIDKGLSEMHRVLKPGGKAVILECSNPRSFPIKQLYHFYFYNLLPLIGRMVSKDPRAYTYLPESVSAFPHGEKFMNLCKKAGFTETKQVSLTFGIASVYLVVK